MIQRIQSVYLLIASVLTLCGLAFTDCAAEGWNEIAKSFLAISGLMALICIFQYKKRMKQVKTILVAQIFIIMSYVVILIPVLLKKAEAPAMSIVLFLPILGFLFDTLARKAIIKDEKLVRSADRIR